MYYLYKESSVTAELELFLVNGVCVCVCVCVWVCGGGGGEGGGHAVLEGVQY